MTDPHTSIGASRPRRAAGRPGSLPRACVSVVVAATHVLLAANAAAQDPMTLNDCIDYALDNSRELARLRRVYEGQRLTTRIHRGKFRPKVNASTSHSLEGRHIGSDRVVQQRERVGTAEMSESAAKSNSIRSAASRSTPTNVIAARPQTSTVCLNSVVMLLFPMRSLNARVPIPATPKLKWIPTEHRGCWIRCG